VGDGPSHAVLSLAFSDGEHWLSSLSVRSVTAVARPDIAQKCRVMNTARQGNVQVYSCKASALEAFLRYILPGLKIMSQTSKGGLNKDLTHERHLESLSS